MTGLRWLPVAGLVLVAWLTAGSMAVRSVSRIWLRHWAERRLRGAATAVTYLERPQRLLIAAGAAIALLLVLIGILLGVRATGTRLVVDVALYGVLALLFGQILPRAVARRWATPLVPVLIPVLQTAEVLAAPILVLGRAVGRRIERRRQDGASEPERDAIQDLLREGELEGVGEQDEIAIISGVVEFGEKWVRDVMTPRAEIFARDEATDPHALAVSIAQSAYSRVPIYRGTLDDIVGMALAFDVLAARGETAPRLHPIAFTTPDARCNDLLFRMLRERRHLAIVREERPGEGGAARTIGLVSLEDLLEELVGDIRDEHDEPPAAASHGPPPGAATANAVLPSRPPAA